MLGLRKLLGLLALLLRLLLDIRSSWRIQIRLLNINGLPSVHVVLLRLLKTVSGVICHIKPASLRDKRPAQLVLRAVHHLLRLTLTHLLNHLLLLKRVSVERILIHAPENGIEDLRLLRNARVPTVCWAVLRVAMSRKFSAVLIRQAVWIEVPKFPGIMPEKSALRVAMLIRQAVWIEVPGLMLDSAALRVAVLIR